MSEFERWYKPLTFPLFGLTKERDQFLFEAGRQSALNRKGVLTQIKHTNSTFSTNCGYKICGSTGVYCDKCGEVKLKAAE